jgi:excisionase family DNA binding protein
MWLTLKEAADYLGISEKSLRGKCKRRELPYRKEGSRGRGGAGIYLFRQSDLEAYLQSKMIMPVVKQGYTIPKKATYVPQFLRL